MPVLVESELSQFAVDVASGFSTSANKYIAPRYFYDDLGSTLFEAITLLPEYGLTRADERLLRVRASDIGQAVGCVGTVAELGSGSGKKTLPILQALQKRSAELFYRPIDVSGTALLACQREIGNVCAIKPVCNDWLQGMAEVARERQADLPLLLLFLGSSIGNLERESIPDFLQSLLMYLQPGDFFLLGADLVKDVDTMLAAYDDPIGVTAAFNLNVLGRMNRELQANFNLRAFVHEARWNADKQRIEMHLLSCQDQEVQIGALNATYHFQAGETIWTESSHKFTVEELNQLAQTNSFKSIASWVDEEWPFAEVLWQVI